MSQQAHVAEARPAEAQRQWRVRTLAPQVTDLEVHRLQELEDDLARAYGGVEDDRRKNLRVWNQTRETWARRITELHFGVGYEASGLMKEVFIERCFPALPPGSTEKADHIAFLRAMTMPGTRMFQEHLLYRYNRGGNFLGQVTGETGMTKSSVALGLAEWFAESTPARQMSLMVYHAWKFPDVYREAVEGEIVIVDENDDPSGEGSGTLRKTKTMMRQQTRQSRVSVLELCPEEQEKSADQFRLNVEFVDWDAKRTLLSLWRGSRPIRYVELDWCSPKMWAAYGPWKEANVQRSKGGDFNDDSALFRMVNALTNGAKFRLYVTKLNKPTKTDLTSTVRVTWGRYMPDSQVDSLVNLMYTLAYGWDRWRDDFEKFAGEPASEGMKALAKTCYKEG